MKKDEILSYCHIGKVGGKQLQFYLRSHFGYRYRCVDHAINRYYEPADLGFELSLNPRIQYLGGHDVRPNIDFAGYDSRLRWFSFFREPRERLLSHYYQQANKPGASKCSLMQWIEANPNRAHWNIYMIAGEHNLQRAIDITNTKFKFVGLTEHYEESLFLLAHQFDLRNFRFYDQRNKKPPENRGLLDKIVLEANTNEAELNLLIADDIKLYGHIREKYQQQRNNYGRDNLQQDLDAYLANSKPFGKFNANNMMALSLDHLFWRPVTKLRKRIR